MNRNVLFRMRDVALCLLYTQHHSNSLNRIQLQKMIYLLDCVNFFLTIISVDSGHKTYYYGPYDKNIQNAADSLVFYQLVDSFNYRITNNELGCQYQLTIEGYEWISELILSDNNTLTRSEITKGLIDSLMKRNLLNKLISLVYSEPLFIKNRQSGYGVILDFNDLDNNEIFSLLTIILDTFVINKKDIYIPLLCDIIVEYLDKRRYLLAINQEEAF